MATTVARLQAVLDADTRGFDAKMRTSSSKTEKAGHIMKGALIGGVAAGITAVGVAAKIGWDEYNQGAAVAAQTNAVIKSTGGVAKVTAKTVEDLGGNLMKLSGIDDEVIKSGENVLLTFTNIRNESTKDGGAFTAATQAALDLSVAMGKDMTSSAVMVGKALNNPIKGLTALTRVGVAFTDQQVKQITKLTENGKIMEAQKIILGELNKEFGGSAKAAGETFGGQLNILHERLNNFLGDVVEKAIPYLQRFIKWIGPKAHDALELAKRGFNFVRESVQHFGQVLDKHRDTVNKIIRVLGFLWDALTKVWKVELKVAGIVVKAWEKILDITLTVADKVIGAVQHIIDWVQKIPGAVRAIAGPFRAAFNILMGPINTVINAVQRLIDLINAIPSVNPFRSENAGTPTGRGGSGRPNPNEASGGPVFGGAGRYLVGERGPELFVPRTSGTIIPHHRLGGGGGIVVNLNGTLIDDRAGEKVVRMLEDWQRRGGRTF